MPSAEERGRVGGRPLELGCGLSSPAEQGEAAREVRAQGDDVLVAWPVRPFRVSERGGEKSEGRFDVPERRARDAYPSRDVNVSGWLGPSVRLRSTATRSDSASASSIRPTRR
jgi:hypothetical protein